MTERTFSGQMGLDTVDGGWDGTISVTLTGITEGEQLIIAKLQELIDAINAQSNP